MVKASRVFNNKREICFDLNILSQKQNTSTYQGEITSNYVIMSLLLYVQDKLLLTKNVFHSYKSIFYVLEPAINDQFSLKTICGLNSFVKLDNA